MEEHKPLKVDGFDDCIVGLIERFGLNPVFCYDKQKIVTKIVSQQGIPFEQAIEHFEFNIASSFHGKGTPCFLTKQIDCCLVQHED